MCEKSEANSPHEVKITSAMIDAGEDAILREVGGAEGLGGHFSARDLAAGVFLAMDRARKEANVLSRPQSGQGFRPKLNRGSDHLA